MFVANAQLPRDPIDPPPDTGHLHFEFIKRSMKLDKLVMHEVAKARYQNLLAQLAKAVVCHMRVSCAR